MSYYFPVSTIFRSLIPLLPDARLILRHQSRLHVQYSLYVFQRRVLPAAIPKANMDTSYGQVQSADSRKAKLHSPGECRGVNGIR